MRIGLVLPAVPAYSETFFVNKIKGLQSHGHEVILFVNAKKIPASFEGATVQAMPSWSGNPTQAITQFLVLLIFHFKTVTKFCQSEQKDHASAFTILKRILINRHLLSQKLDWIHFGFGTMALERENVAEAIGAKMAVSFRGYDHYVYPLKNKNCYAKLFSKKVKYHVLSEGMKKTLLQKGIPPTQIIIITPAIDIALFAKNEKSVSNPILQIATVARLHWIKGLEYTLEALAILKQKNIEFHFTIIGDGPEKERLKFAAHQWGLTKQITFTGKVPPQEVKNVLETQTVYLQYSLQEGFCNAVLEAQAMGKLCIVSDAEGLTENVIDGSTGFVVPKRNSLSLADKMMEVYQLSEDKKLTIANQAILRVKENFTTEKQQQEFIRFYQ